MPPIERIALSLLPFLTVGFVVKLFTLLGLFLYLVFAMVVIRQVQLMSQTVQGALDVPLKLFAWVHFGLAVIVFLFTLLVL